MTKVYSCGDSYGDPCMQEEGTIKSEKDLLDVYYVRAEDYAELESKLDDALSIIDQTPTMDANRRIRELESQLDGCKQALDDATRHSMNIGQRLYDETGIDPVTLSDGDGGPPSPFAKISQLETRLGKVKEYYDRWMNDDWTGPQYADAMRELIAVDRQETT